MRFHIPSTSYRRIAAPKYTENLSLGLLLVFKMLRFYIIILLVLSSYSSISGVNSRIIDTTANDLPKTIFQYGSTRTATTFQAVTLCLMMFVRLNRVQLADKLVLSYLCFNCYFIVLMKHLSYNIMSYHIISYYIIGLSFRW